MERVVFLEKCCVELESMQGVVSGTLDFTTWRVQAYEATLAHHCGEIRTFNSDQAGLISQWEPFQQKWQRPLLDAS
jgi:hypothetical protein